MKIKKIIASAAIAIAGVAGVGVAQATIAAPVANAGQYCGAYTSSCGGSTYNNTPCRVIRYMTSDGIVHRACVRP